MSRAHPLKSILKQAGLVRIVRPRRFHAFALGAPKTGTTSLSAMLNRDYRAEHEPLRARTMEWVRTAHRGGHSHREMLNYLRWRDRELHLEMESSHPMTVLAGALAEAFPGAKFILTFRDPRSWLDSIINMRMTRAVHRFDLQSPTPQGQFFRELNQIYYHNRFPVHSPDEVLLQELGLFTLDGYLSGWVEHYRTVLDEIPPERLLVMDVKALSAHPDLIASFLGIPVETIDVGRSHVHRAAEKHGVLERLPAGLVEAKIAQWCDPTLERISTRLMSPVG